MTETWLPTSVFASTAAISPQKARRALQRAFEGGRPWRGASLQVRRTRKPGGASGWSYEVLLDSLPDDIQQAYRASNLPAPKRQALPAPQQGASLEIEEPCPVAHWRYEIIREALKHEPGTRDRAKVLQAASEKVRVWPSGRKARVDIDTLRRWVRAYERDNLKGLRRQRRADKGEARYVISKTWDDAVPFEDDTKQAILEALLEDVRGLWAKNLKAGQRKICRWAEPTLQDLTVRHGFDPGEERLKVICIIPRRIAEMGRRAGRALAVYDNDRKTWFDNMPRILRTRTGRKPMEIVFGDVHHVDILHPRGDGSTFTAKIIAWQDWATNRVFWHVVFPAKRRVVTREDVAEAYIMMVTHPEWGVPEHLYLDNGSEYNWAPFVDDAQRLNTQVRMLDDDPGLRDALQARRSSIIKAQPYNAPAKAIEGLFGVLEGGVFSALPGWIGGDRFKKKTQNVGKAPKPYPNGEEEFLRIMEIARQEYETTPQHGALGGKSPRQVFTEAVEAGWQRMDIDPDALRAAFARNVSRTVSRGAFSFKGAKYTHREIQKLPAKTPLIVRDPLFGDKSRLPVLREDGSLLCIAEADKPYDVLDPAGAREAAERRRAARQAMEDLRLGAANVDMEDRLARVVSLQRPAPTPESAGTIRMGNTLQQIGQAMAQAPEEEEAQAAVSAEQEREERRQAMNFFLEKSRANG